MYTFKYPQETVPADGEEACGMILKKEVLGYYMDVTLLGINPQNPYFDAPVSKGQSRVLISSAAASKCALKTGDKLVLNDKRNDKSYAFTVDGIVPYAAGMFVFMDIDSMRELIGEKEDYYNIVFAGHALDIDSGRLYAVSSKAEVEKRGYICRKDVADDQDGGHRICIDLFRRHVSDVKGNDRPLRCLYFYDENIWLS